MIKLEASSYLALLLFCIIPILGIDIGPLIAVDPQPYGGRAVIPGLEDVVTGVDPAGEVLIAQFLLFFPCEIGGGG